MIQFLIPGLAGFAQQREGRAAPLPQSPALDRMLTRSKRSDNPHESLEAVLFDLFKVPVTGGKDLPVAEIAHLADLPDLAADPATDNNRHWLRADPVYLRADRDHLRLFDAHVLDLERQEAQALAADINNIYQDDGWQIHVAAADRWYLSLPLSPEIHTHPPIAVAGRVMDTFLPSGPDAKRWHAVMTEMQMLMHMSRVNQQREAKGQFPANSVWLWGSGEMPVVPKSTLQVFSNEPVARGLTLAAGETPADLPRNFYELAQQHDDLSASHYLIVLDALQRPSVYNDEAAWLSQIVAWERDWFAPVLEQLQSTALDTVSFIPVNGSQYHINRSGLRRFWRRGHFWQDRNNSARSSTGP